MLAISFSVGFSCAQLLMRAMERMERIARIAIDPVPGLGAPGGGARKVGEVPSMGVLGMDDGAGTCGVFAEETVPNVGTSAGGDESKTPESKELKRPRGTVFSFSTGFNAIGDNTQNPCVKTKTW